MNLTLDMGMRISEIIGVVVVLAMMKSDVNWLKKEVSHLRGLCEHNFLRRNLERTDRT